MGYAERQRCNASFKKDAPRRPSSARSSRGSLICKSNSNRLRTAYRSRALNPLSDAFFARAQCLKILEIFSRRDRFQIVLLVFVGDRAPVEPILRPVGKQPRRTALSLKSALDPAGKLIGPVLVEGVHGHFLRQSRYVFRHHHHNVMINTARLCLQAGDRKPALCVAAWKPGRGYRRALWLIAERSVNPCIRRHHVRRTRGVDVLSFRPTDDELDDAFVNGSEQRPRWALEGLP